MPETVIERHYRDRVESLRRIALAHDGNGSRSWQFYEDLVNVCEQLSAAGRELLEQERKRVFKEPHLTIAWLRERRQVMEALTNDYVNVVETVREAAVRAAAESAKGTGIEGRLDGAIQALVTARESTLARWLVGTDEETAAAAAAAARGEGIDIEEAFAELAGVDVASWLRRIAAKKANERP